MTLKECYQLLRDSNLNTAQACGILANIEAESACNENALGDLKDGKYTSYGLCQWHGVRWERLQAYAGMVTSIPPDVQINWMKIEMQKYYPKTWKLLNATPDDKDGAAKLAYYFCYNYEVPSKRQVKSEKRATRASELFEMFYEAPISLDQILDQALNKIIEAEEILKSWKKQ